MKPAPFAYQRPGSVADAMQILRRDSGVNKFIGGGQSLGPMLNLRLVRPALLVDISGLDELRGCALEAGCLKIGGAVTHAEIEDGALDSLLQNSPALAAMLRHVAGTIAYRAVRTRGTLGGSLAHADPAADWILAMTALDAQMNVSGHDGQRTVPMSQFMSGAFTTALREGDVLAGVTLPLYSADMRWGYYKFCRKTGEFAEASCAAVFDPARGIARVIIGALDGAPALLKNLANDVAARGVAALSDQAIADAVKAAGAGHDAAERQMIITVVKRCIKQALGAS